MSWTCPDRWRPIAGALALALIANAAPQTTGRAQPAAAPASNVVIVTLDGLRWQEMFGGAGRDYLKTDGGGEPGALEKRFLRESPEERRAALMPFMWGTIARQGQIFGDASRGSRAHVTNGKWFSYPGYNEMFSGAADARVDSNDKIPNPNVTVLEWLNGRPGFRGRVAAFGSWDVLPFILNTARSGIPVGSGYALLPSPGSERERAINELAEDLPHMWGYGPFDAPVVYAALETIRAAKPRILYLMLGEGDEWAHLGNYALYLDAAHRSDRFIQRIWTTLQGLPDYAQRTTLLVTTDHGRGATTSDWSDHGTKVPAAETTWIAALGAGVAPLGVRGNVEVTASQIAATIAALVGEDFRRASPSAAPPLPLAPGR
jgi:hypothetical protein